MTVDEFARADKCPYCHRKMTKAVWAFKRQLKVNNALASVAKMKAKGGKYPGGRNKLRNDDRIKALRKQGLSMRAIAKEIGLSTSAVQRGLKS